MGSKLDLSRWFELSPLAQCCAATLPLIRMFRWESVARPTHRRGHRVGGCSLLLCALSSALLVSIRAALKVESERDAEHAQWKTRVYRFERLFSACHGPRTELKCGGLTGTCLVLADLSSTVSRFPPTDARQPPARPASSWLQLCPPGRPAGAYTVDQVLPIMTNRTPRVGFRRRCVRLSVRRSVAEWRWTTLAGQGWSRRAAARRRRDIDVIRRQSASVHRRLYFLSPVQPLNHF